MKQFVELTLFAVSWAAIAGVIYWVAWRLRMLRRLHSRVDTLETAVFGDCPDVDCALCNAHADRPVADPVDSQPDVEPEGEVPERESAEP